MNRKMPLPVILVGLLTFFFLYAPIFFMMFYSFNSSKLVTVWAGFSVKWYAALFQNEAVLTAAFTSLKIALISATLASILGIMAGFSLVRFSRFRGRKLLAGMITAPLVIPEVIMGISLLLLFVSMELLIGWPGSRGITTIIIAHATFSAAFVAVIIEARLRDFDVSVEDAAIDLGARQPMVFFSITLPIISPAVISGWLLAFSLSLDDLVIASFVSGPSSTTLPILIFSKMRLGVKPDVNALATLLVLVAVIFIIIISWLMSRHEKLRENRGV